MTPPRAGAGQRACSMVWPAGMNPRGPGAEANANGLRRAPHAATRWCRQRWFRMRRSSALTPA